MKSFLESPEHFERLGYSAAGIAKVLARLGDGRRHNVKASVVGDVKQYWVDGVMVHEDERA